MNGTHYKTTFFATLSVLLGISASNAQDIESLAMGFPPPGGSSYTFSQAFPSNDLYKLTEDNFQKLDTGLLGDLFNTYTGELSFRQTDLAISTNLGIPMEVIRESINSRNGHYRIFGNWILAIPTLYASLAGNFTSGLDRCTNFWTTSRYRPGSLDAQLLENAPQLGGVGGSKQLLRHDGSLSAPPNTLFISMDNWAVTCSNNIYKAHAPDGTKYTFGQLVQLNGNNAPRTTLASNAERGYSMLMVTKIEDRFGKSINFNYQNGLLSSISSDEGPQISFRYNSNYDVADITANGQVWRYSYNSNHQLIQVELPNGTTWELNNGALISASSSETSITGSITHPLGTKGSFTIQRTRHGRTKVPTSQNVESGYLYEKDTYYHSLATKTLTGPQLTPMSWTYSYSQEAGAYLGESASNFKSVLITNPEGHKRRYTLHRSLDELEGKIQKISTESTSSTLQTITQTWVRGAAIGQIVGDLAFGSRSNGYRANLNHEVTTRGSDSFTQSFYNYSSWGLPGKIVASTNLTSTKRYATQTYLNDIGLWIIGLPVESKVSEDGTTYYPKDRTTYYSASHSYSRLPYQRFRHNRLIQTYNSYLTNGISSGMVGKITDHKLGSYSVISQYKHGIPTILRRPSLNGGADIESIVSVDNNGRVISIKDYRGFVTNFNYNELGWLTSKVPINQGLNSTSINYAILSDGIYKTVSKGKKRTTTIFDSLLRPVEFFEEDLSAFSTYRAKSRKYDSNGNIIFESFWDDVSQSDGHSYSYDALDRLIKVIDTSTTATTSYTFLSGHRVRQTDARGFATTKAFQSFGNPNYSHPIKIVSPESLVTTIAYNLHQQITNIAQGGVTEQRVYNGYRDLCKIIRSDVGNHGYYYNVYGRLERVVQGSSIDDTLSCDNSPSNTETQSFTYNSRGAIKQISFGDNTPSKNFGYDANDNLISAVTSGVSKLFEFNSQNQLEQQTTQVDNSSYTINYEYDANSHLNHIIYPDGEILSLQPNALGQQRSVGGYVGLIKYHPNGAIKSYVMANDAFRTTTQHINGALDSIIDRHPSTIIFNQTYQYDLNMNTVAINQSTVISNSTIELNYDGLDRLIGFSSALLGNGLISYDTRNNVTSLDHPEGTLEFSYLNNRLVSTSGLHNWTFSYDDRGNVTNNGRYNLSFNLAGQLTTANGSDYLYDAENMRVRSITSAGARYDIYDNKGKLIYSETPTGIEKYYYASGTLVAKKTSSGLKYAHTDQLGSTVGFSNAKGAMTEERHYHPFGGTINGTFDDVGYTSHKFDSNLGLSYMQARYYDPVIGRFYSNDPVGFTGEVDTFNRYSYVANNPYKYTDPTGEAKVYIWNKGPTPTGNSIAGHVAIETDNGSYVSKFPSNSSKWSSKAKFHTQADDKKTYGRDADTVIELDLPNEDAAGDFAEKLLGDDSQVWTPTDNCADAVETVINAGGKETPKNDPINTPQRVKEEIQPKKETK